jgi:acyl-coenzyme A synthetase/AMP-(fatty) acid ligase/acyl carrier protein
MVVFPLAQELGIPDLLTGLIDRYDITCIDITPSHFQKLIRYLNSFSTPSSLERLKYILIGGEAIIPQDVYEFRKQYPHITIFNTYGPTETAIGTIFFQIPQKAITPIPLGKPLPNTKAVILNRELQILPPNIVGELHLGGACMGLGYLNNKEATREKFIPNPFKELDCLSLYKTGDLAYYSEEGLIYFIGRIDTQIKLHGARIEPGEIEAILIQQPGISQAVVTLEHDQNQEAMLVAYLVFSPLFTPSLRAIKDALYSKLPLYMVPTQFFQVDSIPELNSGKIDRMSLRKKTNVALSIPKGNAEIASPFEQKIIQIWLEVLQIEAIDINDHFFVDLHCDSLGLLLFIFLLDKQLQIALSTQEIYAAPTPKLLVQYILTKHLPANK